MKNSKKILSIIATFGFATVASLNVMACNNNQDINFALKNLVKKNNIMATAKDDKGNLYYATFDTPDLNPGEKIWKYDIETKTESLYWENSKFKVASFDMQIDNKGNIYLASSGGVTILKNNNQMKVMPKVIGAISQILVKNNDVYIASVDGFFKYNINTENTEKIHLPDNSHPVTLFIDSNDNLYIGTYNKLGKVSVYFLAKNEQTFKPIMGDDFFKTNIVTNFLEINKTIFFYCVNYNEKKAYLYAKNINNDNTVNPVVELPITQAIFNINNQIGLLVTDNNNLLLKIIINNTLEQKYILKNNNHYNDRIIIANYENLILPNKVGIDILSW